MKSILVPTDFSPPAKNAARYAVHLATMLQENVMLCHALTIPAAIFAGQLPGPLEDDQEIKQQAEEELQACVKQLEGRLDEQAAFFPKGFQPAVGSASEVGPVTDVIRNMFDEHNGSVVVMGMSGAGNLERLFIGSSSRDLVDKANFPVLLIPPGFIFRPIQKIAFATDLDKSDINVVHSLACFAQALGAEIQIRHIADHKFERGEDKYKADAFMAELCKKVNYSRVSYHHIKSMDVDHGLDWLHEHSLVDLLVMVHRPHHFLAQLVFGSHTQQVARHVTLPLLVFPRRTEPSFNVNKKPYRC